MCFISASDSCNSEEDNVKNGGFVDDIDLRESIASSIFQPSTSRAVWNPYTLNYEDRMNCVSISLEAYFLCFFFL